MMNWNATDYAHAGLQSLQCVLLFITKDYLLNKFDPQPVFCTKTFMSKTIISGSLCNDTLPSDDPKN